MEIEVTCPVCEAEFVAGPEEAAGEIECPECGSFFRRSQMCRRRPKKRKRWIPPKYAWVIGFIVALNIIFLLLPEDEGEEEPGLSWLVNEPMAQEAMWKISAAQQCYREKYETYSTLKALREERLIAFDLSAATGGGVPKWGYRYFVEFNRGESWWVVAVPAEPNVSGTRSFYLDETGIMRWSPYLSEDYQPAGRDSPEVE